MIYNFFGNFLSPRASRFAAVFVYLVMLVAIYLALDAPEAQFLYGRL